MTPDDLALLGLDLRYDLGERATLVQLSTAFCAPCRTARQVLVHVAQQLVGVRYVDVDAESHLEGVRALGVESTPTTLVLDSRGAEVGRAVGVPSAAAVRAVVEALPPA